MRRSMILTAMLLIPAVAFAGFRASSFRKETRLGANYWNIASALDSKLETCWMVDAESDNVGEWIEVDLPRGEVDKIGLVTGWAKDDETFTDYARVKAAKIEVFGSAQDTSAKVSEQTIQFEDKNGWQIIDLNDVAMGGDLSGGRLRLTVTEIYPGTDYPNLAISEALVYLKDQEVPLGSMNFRTPPVNISEGHGADAMLDGNLKTFWAGAGDAAFEVKAEGYGVSAVGIALGPITHARPKTIEISVNDLPVTTSLVDKPDLQWIQLPAVVGYTGSAWGAVKVRVVDTYSGKQESAVSIAELKLRYTNFEGL